MFPLLDNPVISYFRFMRTIGSYSQEEHEDLLDTSNQFRIKARDIRTLPENICISAGAEMIEQLPATMPKSK